MQGNFSKNLSANTIQQLINQLFGLIIFYILSTQFNKASFGQLQWCLAVLLTIFNLLSCGMDHVIVKKVAEGSSSNSLLSLYLFHVLLSGVIFYLLLGLGYFFMPTSKSQYLLLLFIGFGKLLIFFSTPFKQITSGLEKFNTLAYMSVASNVTRAVALIILTTLYRISINTVIIIFIIGDFAELILSVFLYSRILKLSIRLHFYIKEYFALIRESIPQIGVVFFTSSLARFDWILMGMIVSSEKLAEYSFAYKAFEISSLPLVIIAPLLLPRFTRLFKQKKISDDIYSIVKLEMIIVFITILVLNISWAPMVDSITNGKYGSNNSVTIFLLSLSLPFLYLTNFLWSILFAHSKLKTIFSIIAITFLVNVIADIIFIPIYKKEGAAIAYLIALITQFVLYALKSPVNIVLLIKPFFFSAICAAIAGLLFYYFNHQFFVIAVVSTGICFVFLQIVSKQLSFSNIKAMNHFMNS